MPNRLTRLWAWTSVGLVLLLTFFPWQTTFAEIPEETTVTTTEQQPAPVQTPTLEAVINPVLNEIRAAVFGVNLEFVELYNPGSTTVNLSGWKLTASSGVITTFAAGTTIGAQNWLSVSLANVLADSDDTVTLISNTSTQIDQIHYGLTSTAQISAPNPNLSIGRRSDGDTNWFAQLIATPGTTNGGSLTLQKPANSFVQGGTNNPADTINLATKGGVLVQTSLPASSLATDQIIFDLVDAANTLKFVSQTAVAGSGTLVSGPIDTTATPTMVDGLVTVRAFAKASDGIETTYALGTPATRDTVAPAAGPSSLSIIASTSPNPANIINSLSLRTVKTQVVLPTSTLATDTLRVELSDGSRSVSQSITAPAGGGTLTLGDGFGTQSLNAESLADGPIAMKATLIDSAGNSGAAAIGTQATKDTQAPSGSLEINNQATVTASATVMLAINAADIGTGVTEIRLANINSFAGTNFEPIVGTKTWSLIPGNGPRSVYLQVKDAAGNISVARNVASHAEALILVRADATGITQTALPVGTQAFRQLPLEIQITANSPTNLTTAAFATNPGTSLPGGTTSVGSFREIGVADITKITFPITIKIYYSAADLTAAGVTNENQLIGLGFFNLATNSWKTYETTGVVTTDQVVDGTTYAGYFFATASHLTPIVALADIAPPAAPAQATATAGNQSVDLTWSAVSQATSYVVRYRISGSNDAYKSVSLSSQLLSTKITKLTNETSYEFGIAARDAAGNQSAFTLTTATPVGPAVVIETPVRSLTVLAPRAKAGVTGKITPPATVPTPVSSVQPESGITPGKSPSDRDTSRLLMLFAILLIAVGAGLAGFYGYQWWATRPIESGSVAPPNTPPPAPASRPAPPSSPSSQSSLPPNQPPETPDEPPTGRW